MSISLKCDGCGQELTEPGALLFGPPMPTTDGKTSSVVAKRHVCGACYPALLNFLSQLWERM